jgi:hypothetical protein
LVLLATWVERTVVAWASLAHIAAVVRVPALAVAVLGLDVRPFAAGRACAAILDREALVVVGVIVLFGGALRLPTLPALLAAVVLQLVPRRRTVAAVVELLQLVLGALVGGVLGGLFGGFLAASLPAFSPPSSRTSTKDFLSGSQIFPYFDT